MKEKIQQQIESAEYANFVFKPMEKNPVHHLKDVSKNVPYSDGNYYVFSESNNNTSEHLLFTIQELKLELIYFGVAGGETKNGKNGDQKLDGRINNVVGKPSIPRAKYWVQEMNRFKIEKLIVFYCKNLNPKEIEDFIYNFLKKNKLDYPKLNKKRGRQKKSHLTKTN